jgi:uncharacterized protein YeaO (DUF488 family)
MAIGSFQIGTPREPGEGLRIGTVRFLPRGISKKDYARLDQFDIWLPALAPSRKLLAGFRTKLMEPASLRKFFARYRAEMLADTDCRQTLLLLARLGRTADFSVGCYCEDEKKCHRSELLRLLRAAGRGKLDSSR